MKSYNSELKFSLFLVHLHCFLVQFGAGKVCKLTFKMLDFYCVKREKVPFFPSLCLHLFLLGGELYFLFQCEAVQQMLEGLAAQRGNLQPRLEVLERDVIQLSDWAAGLSEKRDQLHGSLTSLRDAVTQIEERTSAITKDFANKVYLIVLFFSHK